MSMSSPTEIPRITRFPEQRSDAEYIFYKDYPKQRLDVEYPQIQEDDIVIIGSYYP